MPKEDLTINWPDGSKFTGTVKYGTSKGMIMNITGVKDAPEPAPNDTMPGGNDSPGNDTQGGGNQPDTVGGGDGNDTVAPEPTGPVKFEWNGPFTEALRPQHEGGSTSILPSFEGRDNVLRCDVGAVGQFNPTKANRESRGFSAREGEILVCAFDLWVPEFRDIKGYRTYLDAETLGKSGNPGGRISDIEGVLAFNDKFGPGHNYKLSNAPKIRTGRWQRVEFEVLLSRRLGQAIIKLDGVETCNWRGVTMGDYVTDRIQWGVASDSDEPFVAYLARPFVQVRALPAA